MREIKFKAIELDELTGRKTTHYYGIGGKPQLLGGNRGWLAEDLQFTGLKDRNGKEIYESDIVRVYDPRTSKWNEPSEHTSRVVFENACFIAMDTNGNIQPLSQILQWKEYRKIEIIGNIYETPDLIKGMNR